ncbi:MAG TPA: adenylyltransferase, partial [Desulfofustis sp.]|nr:adenylyltransferase [Desulfofustis sp.]
MKTDEYSESLVVHFQRGRELRREALTAVALDLNERQLFDLELLLNRGFYPLTGFMTESVYESVLEHMALPDGTIWPIPICLDVD